MHSSLASTHTSLPNLLALGANSRLSASTDNAPRERPKTDIDQSLEPAPRTDPPSRHITIVTGSVAQVPPDIAQRLGIRVIPFIVSLDGRDYLDGVDLSSAELYSRMRVEKALPTTSTPSIGEYAEVFRDCLKSGTKDILYVAISSRLSVACSGANRFLVGGGCQNSGSEAACRLRGCLGHLGVSGAGRTYRQGCRHARKRDQVQTHYND